MKKTILFSAIAALVLTTSCNKKMQESVDAQQQAINKIQYEITRQAEEIQALQENAANDSIDGVAIKDIIIGQQYQLEQLNGQLTRARKDLYSHLNASGLGEGSAYNLTASCFGIGSAVLTKEAHTLLDSIVPDLKANAAVTVKVNGHTDNTGSDAINNALSLKRAESVKAYLVKQGIAADRITTQGFGSSKPIACNDNAEARSKNRRVEVVLSGQE